MRSRACKFNCIPERQAEKFVGNADTFPACVVNSSFWCGMVPFLSKAFDWDFSAYFCGYVNARATDLSLLDKSCFTDFRKYSKAMAQWIKNAWETTFWTWFPDSVAVAAKNFFDCLFLQFLAFSGRTEFHNDDCRWYSTYAAAWNLRGNFWLSFFLCIRCWSNFTFTLGIYIFCCRKEPWILWNVKITW